MISRSTQTDFDVDCLASRLPDIIVSHRQRLKSFEQQHARIKNPFALAKSSSCAQQINTPKFASVNNCSYAQVFEDRVVELKRHLGMLSATTVVNKPMSSSSSRPKSDTLHAKIDNLVDSSVN